MSYDVEKLYSLLPAVYRIRDIELARQLPDLLTKDETADLDRLLGMESLSEKQLQRLAELEEKRQRGPLKSLLSVIAEQALVLEEDLDQLYDNLFIETCAEWVVPYIGELIGVRGISAFPGASFTQRSFVANTMANRRRKGTAAVIEQLARDVTDWDASVVEYFQRLATTQYLNHLRPENLSLISVRDSTRMESVDTPFDSTARTAEVRRIESRRGKYNIPNIGIFLWRLRDYSVTSAQPYLFDERRFLFDPLGKDIQLFNQTEPEKEITHLAEPVNVAMGLSRRVLARSLRTYYVNSENPDARSILLLENHPLTPIDVERVTVCDLSDLLDAGGNVVTDANGKALWSHLPNDKIAIDPLLGRISFPPNQIPENLHVTYHYGFSADMGGGEYDRGASLTSDLHITEVSEMSSIATALDGVKTTGGIVEIKNNDQFVGGLNVVAGTESGVEVELRGADGFRPVVIIAANQELSLSGADESEITINGLLIGGGVVRILPGPSNKLRRLRLVHCTLAPGIIPQITVPGSTPTVLPAQPAKPRLVIELENTEIEIDHCIVGQIRVVPGAQVRITNSIVDASDTFSIAYAGLDNDGPGAPLQIENSTVIGKVFTRKMELASNTIFLADTGEGGTWPAPVRAERLQEGCVRFSYIPPASLLPAPHRCQPSNLADAERVRPSFTSLRYGDAGYCQLDQSCAVEITQGSDDQVEMGAFHNLFQPRREANLRAALNEYLRFGLEAGIFYAS